MKYVDSILETGENVGHRARVHWVAYLPGLAALALGIATAVFAGDPALQGLAVIFGAFLFLVMTLLAFIRRRTTELAVTDKRVIVKTGWIKRDTAEINRDRVEGVSVNQSVLGRILGYGTVGVQGTGGGIAPVKGVDDPIAFRRAVGT